MTTDYKGPMPTDRPVIEGTDLAIQDEPILFLGERGRGTSRTVFPKAVIGWWIPTSGPLAGYRIAVRPPTRWGVKPHETHAVSGFWGGRRKNLIIAAPPEYPFKELIEVYNADELPEHPLIRTDDGRPAFRWNGDGAPCFLDGSMTDLGKVTRQKPVWLVGGAGTYYTITRRPETANLLRERGGRDPRAMDWLRHGGFWDIPVNPENLLVGWENPTNGGKFELHKLTLAHEVLGLRNPIPKLEEVGPALTATLTAINSLLSDERLAQYVAARHITPESAKKLSGYREKKIEVAHSAAMVLPLAIQQEEEKLAAAARSRKASGGRSPASRLAALVGGEPITVAALASDNTKGEWPGKWEEVLRTVLEELGATLFLPNAPEWGARLAEQCDCRPEDADIDPEVVLEQFRIANIPHEYQEVLLEKVYGLKGSATETNPD